MKFIFAIVCCLISCTWYSIMAIDPPKESSAINSTNTLYKAFIDVKGDNDGLYIEGIIWDNLKDLGIGIALSDRDKENADIKVICRFKHKLMLPVITRGAQIKMTELGKCTIKIVDKKTERVLIEKSWVRGKRNGEVEDFFGSVFAEFKKGLETNAVPPVPKEPHVEITNCVPAPKNKIPFAFYPLTTKGSKGVFTSNTDGSLMYHLLSPYSGPGFWNLSLRTSINTSGKILKADTDCCDQK